VFHVKQNTVAAISTPIGTGGIGIVRLSGAEAIEIAARIFRPYGSTPLREKAGYTGCLGKIWSGDVPVDEAIAFVYKAPKSYTGEDVVELSCHGGLWILRQTLRLCLENGAIAAQPGEFTRRAFQNGKMDLMQAEAVMQLIHAEGEAALQAALSARDGALTGAIAAVRGTLVQWAAHLAAWVDYPDEGIADVDTNALSAALEDCRGHLDALLATYDKGKILREGVHTAIVGKPNVGKSTLMNLLSGRPRSIVTEIPGTTRDVVEETVRLGDFVLRLYDTAGIRGTEDVIEKIGVEKSKQVIEETQLVLAVFDGSRELEEDDWEIIDYAQGKPIIAVVNKADLPGKLEQARIRERICRVVALSAVSGEGLDQLEQEILECLGINHLDTSAPMIGSERQRQALLEANASIAGAIEALSIEQTLDAVGVEIDSALDKIFSLTGERVTDKVVDEVFAKFCVGK
jgi:tRNA modification GTPase